MRGIKRSPDNPAEWLHRARSSLALARQKTTDVLYEDLCYQAQQAAEKALKAVLVFGKLHDHKRRRQPRPHHHIRSIRVSIAQFTV